jgi:terminal uridylyltransferase
MNQLNGNPESVGHLLRGFFEYYAHSGPLVTGNGKGFDWGREVLSLRTQGGILTKHNKGWTGAKTVYETQNVEPHTDDGTKTKSLANKGGEEVKEVRLRYLFAIEDPFEIDHNVARTVTHNGIVSIRDEFRRAWRLIKAAGDGAMPEDLLEDVSEAKTDDHDSFKELLHEIHGPVVFDDDDDHDS